MRIDGVTLRIVTLVLAARAAAEGDGVTATAIPLHKHDNRSIPQRVVQL
jgi:hypothetical protein